MDIAEIMLARAAEMGLRVKDERMHIHLPNAREEMQMIMSRLCQKGLVWHTEYDQVAEWLSDNRRKGLLLMGNPGLGKSLLCEKVIPTLVGTRMERWFSVYKAIDLATHFDAIRRKKLLTIDDIGTEPNVTREWGTEHSFLMELLDLAEHEGKTLLMTTNLTWPDLCRRYGQRIDRLKSLVLPVLFTGESHR